MSYVRLSTHEINEIIPLILGSDSNVILQGTEVSVKGVRLESFAVNGCDCVRCGTKGEYFAVEHDLTRGLGGVRKPHLNLYGRNKRGEEVLMTRDHIIAKSKGGPNKVENMQTMCSRCNGKKGSTLFGIIVDGIYVSVDFEGAETVEYTDEVLELLRQKAGEIASCMNSMRKKLTGQES